MGMETGVGCSIDRQIHDSRDLSSICCELGVIILKLAHRILSSLLANYD
jgi:hypothetical protein